MLLSAEHLSKNYGMKTLLEDASIYLEQGEKIGVIGINGTGKSTFLKVLPESSSRTAGRSPANRICRSACLHRIRICEMS